MKSNTDRNEINSSTEQNRLSPSLSAGLNTMFGVFFLQKGFLALECYKQAVIKN